MLLGAPPRVALKTMVNEESGPYATTDHPVVESLTSGADVRRTRVVGRRLSRPAATANRTNAGIAPANSEPIIVMAFGGCLLVWDLRIRDPVTEPPDLMLNPRNTLIGQSHPPPGDDSQTRVGNRSRTRGG